MGTDIHAFVEIDYSDDSVPFMVQEEVRPFNFGEFFIWRNYTLFDALGDGRSHDFDESKTKRHSLYPPRGLPLNYATGVLNRFFYVIDDEGYASVFEPGLRTVSTEEAERWLSEGLSVPGPPLEVYRGNGWEELRRVSNPDWHSASWLRLNEIYDSLTHFDLNPKELHTDFRAILLTMTFIESELGTGRSRLVFWFDN